MKRLLLVYALVGTMVVPQLWRQIRYRLIQERREVLSGTPHFQRR